MVSRHRCDGQRKEAVAFHPRPSLSHLDVTRCVTSGCRSHKCNQTCSLFFLSTWSHSFTRKPNGIINVTDRCFFRSSSSRLNWWHRGAEPSDAERSQSVRVILFFLWWTISSCAWLEMIWGGESQNSVKDQTVNLLLRSHGLFFFVGSKPRLERWFWCVDVENHLEMWQWKIVWNEYCYPKDFSVIVV